MKKIFYLTIALLLGICSCSKFGETDIPENEPRIYPDGFAFRASIASVTKASFTGDRSGRLVWDGDEDVAIIAVPVLDTKGYSFDHLHEYDINNAVTGIASVEVDSSDPTMAILHTAKTLAAWTKDMERVQFFAIYPANDEIPDMDNSESTGEVSEGTDIETKFLYFLKDIPVEQDGVHYQKAMLLGGGTPAYYINEGMLSLEPSGSSVDPVFTGFIPGNAILSFKIGNSLASDLDIARVRISSVQLDDLAAHYVDPEDLALSGTHAFFYDDKYENVRCRPYNPDGTCSYLNNYVDVTFSEPVHLLAGEEGSQIYNVSVSGAGEFKPRDVPGYLRFEAFDAEGNVLAVCEKSYPTSLDGKGDAGTGLERGYRYNFTVTFGEDSPYHFFVSAQPDAAGSWGGELEGMVRSYKVVDGVASYVEWGYNGGIFSDAACTQPIPEAEWDLWLESWEKVSPAEGGSPTDAYLATVTVKPNPNPWVMNTYDCRAEVRNTLAGATQKGTSSSYYNLSNATGGSAIENTANCYVIDAPGYYAFPCVLGNGIKNGAPNSGAWNAADNTDVYPGRGLPVLVDYKGGDVVSPYVHNSSSLAGTPASAVLLWEDVQGLIETSDNTLTLENIDGVYWIKFHIAPSAIDQGNAVLAVRDANGVIMWSWHIWVTDHKFDGSDDTTVEGVKFSKVNLGWVETERLDNMTRAGNTAYVRIVQEESGKTAIVKIVQMGDKDEWCAGMPSDGYNPLYQFGRKDPMIPGIPSGTASAGTNVPVYGAMPSLTVGIYSEAETSSSTLPHHYAIQNPTKLIFGAIDEDKERYHWSYNIIFNSWNMLAGFHKGLEDIDEPQRKSIYDPCPVGYQVPQPYDYRRFYLDNEVTEYDAENDKYRLLGYAYDPNNGIIHSYSTKGIYYSLQGYSSDRIFFPLCSSRTFFGNGALLTAFDKGPAIWSAIGIGNNQEDENSGAEWLTIFLAGTEEDEHSDYEYTKSTIPFSTVGPFMPQGSAGFVRPVEDRSTTSSSLPPVGADTGWSGAGSYHQGGQITEE